jgi:hypothetical protein
LQAQIAAIAALHQPFWESDFPMAHIPDEKNAAVLWKAAFAALPANDTCPSGSSVSFNDYPPVSPQWEQMEDQSIADNAKSFELAHRAAAIERVDWGDNVSSAFAHFQYFAVGWQTANILEDAILHAHLHANDALAVQRAVDVLQLGRAESSVGNLDARYVRIGIQARSSGPLLRISPDLIIQSQSASQGQGVQGGVQRKDVEALIHLLLDESDDARSRIAAIDRERMNEHQILQKQKTQRWTLGPMIDLSEARILAQRTVDRLATAAPSNGAAMAAYVSNPTPPLGQAPLPIDPSTFTQPPQSL